MTEARRRSRAAQAGGFGVGIADDAGEANGVPEVAEAEDGRDDGVERAGDVQRGGPEADRDHDGGVEESLDDGAQRSVLRVGQVGREADAAAGVVFAVHPADGHEVRELPDEEDGEESDAGPLDDAAGGGPADQRRERSGEGADEGVDGGDALERSVDGDVADGGEEREGSGQQVGRVGEVRGAEEGGREAEDETVGEGDAAGGHGAVGGAAHEAVGLALEGLIQRAAAAGDDGDPDEGLQHARVEGADAALEAAEIEAGSGGDDDHGGDADFEERGVVGEERVGLRRCEDVIGCRRGGHRVRISRLRVRRRAGRCGLGAFGWPIFLLVTDSSYSADSPCLPSPVSALLGLRAEEREEDDVADGFGVGEDHGEAVDADAFAGGGREAVAEGADVVLVHLVGFRVAAFFFGHLLLEAGELVDGVVELGEGVADFEAADVELEALDPVGFVGFFLGEWADGEGEVVDDGGLDEVGFGDGFEDRRDGFAERFSFELYSDADLWRLRSSIDHRAIVRIAFAN